MAVITASRRRRCIARSLCQPCQTATHRWTASTSRTSFLLRDPGRRSSCGTGANRLARPWQRSAHPLQCHAVTRALTVGQRRRLCTAVGLKRESPIQECVPGERPDDAISGEAGRLLEPAHGSVGFRAEDAVDLEAL